MMPASSTVLCDLLYEGDAVGHGGHHRSAQLRELVEAAGLRAIMLPRDPGWLNLTYYFLGLRCIIQHRIRPSRNWRWVRRWGRHYARYRQALPALEEVSAVLWEHTRPAGFVTPAIARSAGLPVVAVPANLETFAPGRQIRRPRQFPYRQFFTETQHLGQAQTVFCISREEQWLLAWYGIAAGFLPYYPPKPVLNQMLAVRAQRQSGNRSGRFLMVGTASNPPTRQGMVILLQWLRQIAATDALRVDVAGTGTGTLKAVADHPAFTFHGRVETAQLTELLVNTQAVLIYQPVAVGALTRIPEMLAAGIPVVGNPIACRSATDLPGVYVYEDAAELKALLHTELLIPPLPEAAARANARFTGYLRALAAVGRGSSQP